MKEYFDEKRNCIHSVAFPRARQGVVCIHNPEAKSKIFSDAVSRISLPLSDLKELAKREGRADTVFREQLKKASPGDELGRVVSVNTSCRRGERKISIESGE